MKSQALTKSIVEGITPSTSDVIVRDSVVKGFHLKVTPAGRRIYFVFYRSKDGKQRRPRIGEHGVTHTVQQARDRAREILGEAASGGDPSGEFKARRARSITLRQLWEKHLPEARARWKPRTRQETEWRWARHVEPALGGFRIADISHTTVSELHARLAGTKTEANKVLALVHYLLNVAIHHGIIPPPNPSGRVKKFRLHGRETFLSGDQIACLLDAILEEERFGGVASVKGRVGKSEGRGGKGTREATPRGITPHAAGLFRLLMFTGARLNDIQSAKWAWVDWGASALRLPDSKTGKKTVWLNELALQELRRLEAIKTQDEWIIEGRLLDRHLVSPGRPWARVRERAAKAFAKRMKDREGVQGAAAAIKSVRIHDLRHTFASIGVAAGVPLMVVGKALGHAKATMTERYAHVADNPVLEASRRIGQSIQIAVEEARVANVVPLHASSKIEDAKG